MAGDFDPDAYLAAPKQGGFDPDAYLSTPLPTPRPEIEPAHRQTGRERQQAYLQSLREGATSVPAGQGVSGPDLSAERGTAGQIASEWGDVGRGVAKGVPALTGIPGDIEAMGRGTINTFAPPKQPFVSPETGLLFQKPMPTTTEGGWFGPRGLDIIAPAANAREAFGMGLPAQALPFMPKMIRGARGVPATDLPVPPPGGPAAVLREESGARLLPADVPHVLPAQPQPLGASRSLGAAGTSPLEGISPETITQLRKTFAEEGVTPWTVDERLGEMSPHQFLGEFSPNTEAHMGAVAASPGPGKLEVINSLGQRSKETPARLRATFDQAFGEAENVAQIRRSLEIDQAKAADPFYKTFRETRIPMTETLQDLMPRLEAADVFGVAKHKAALEGVPWTQESFSYGPIRGDLPSPTAQSWDFVKQALDHKIADSFDKFGKATDYTRRYTQIKNELVNAIDNHPNPQVAGVWKQARDAYAGPAQIKDAMRLGQKILTNSVDADELPFMTASYSPAQMSALKVGLRKDLQDMLGSPGKQELRVINKVLGENNQQKLRWVLGDQETANLVRGVEHEFNMHGSPQRIHGGSQTALRTEAQKTWTPQEGFGLKDAADIAVGAVTHPVGTIANVARKVGLARKTSAQEARFAKMREEAARIYTLQGPERDAVIRYLTAPEPYASGGRVMSYTEFSNKNTGGKVERKKSPSYSIKLSRQGGKISQALSLARHYRG